MRNYPEWVISFAAILSVGAVAVSLNAWWTEDELDYAIKDSGLTLFIGDSERISRGVRPCERTGARLLGVRLDADTVYSESVDHWSDVVVAGAPMPDVALDPDDDATILYTSGTTGFPKGRRVDARRDLPGHHGLLVGRNGPSGATRAPGRSGQRPGAGLYFDRAALSCDGLYSGDDVVLLVALQTRDDVSLEREKALALIEKHGVTNFVGVPTQSWDLIESPSFAKYDTSTLTSVGGGGAPASPSLVTKVENSFQKGHPSLGYGMTETNAYGPGNYGEDYLTHPTSTGRVPTIVMDAEIRDEQLQPLANGRSGEIWLKTPTMIRGYWGKPDATREALQDGWLRTGDVGHISDEGFLYVEDRAKDMIIRAGENVYSAQVEAAIYENPAVYEVAVFGLPEERLGEEVGGRRDGARRRDVRGR